MRSRPFSFPSYRQYGMLRRDKPTSYPNKYPAHADQFTKGSNMVDTISIRRIFDAHHHARDGELMTEVARIISRTCGYALMMPNLSPPIATGADASRYRGRLSDACPSDSRPQFVMAIKLLAQTDAAMIRLAAHYRVKAVKFYPLGVTTNSDDGLPNLRGKVDELRAMEKLEMVLCVHGESPDPTIDVMRREEAYLDELDWLVETFPKLKIVLEHVSSAAGVAKVLRLPDTVATTITAHHLQITQNDVLGGPANAHLHCFPVAKTMADRAALIEAATSGNPKFFFGSDSAPHPVEKKESGLAPGGVFTAPIMVEVLAEVFDAAGALDRLQDFTSTFGCRFYNFPVSDANPLTLVREAWTLPDELIAGVKPYKAGQEIGWAIQG